MFWHEAENLIHHNKSEFVSFANNENHIKSRRRIYNVILIRLRTLSTSYLMHIALCERNNLYEYFYNKWHRISTDGIIFKSSNDATKNIKSIGRNLFFWILILGNLKSEIDYLLNRENFEFKLFER